ncbi:MAG TPA: hypothetical protein PLF92_07645 [Arenimonas sp.]|nr:hypothetical protein [Arenimonas sp.]HPO23352.1 hypothetical protein [Arenimonas sp.]HPW32767.1 hypothetical protein [Arenimonas sp.]
MFKRPIFAAILATAIPMSAHAGQFNYNYIELGLDKAKYGQGDASYGRGESINGDGNLSGAFGFADHFYVSGAYRKADFHVEGDILGMNFRAEEDFTYWALNFGYHLSVSENNDFIAEIGRESYSNDTQLFLNDSSFGGGKYTNKNLQAAAGLRTSFGNRLETLAKLAYKDNGAEDYESRLAVELDGMYKFNPTWAVTLNTQVNSSGISSCGLGIRASFGNK